MKKANIRKYKVYKRKKFSHYNYLYEYSPIDLQSSQHSSKGLFNLLSKGAMRYQSNWSDLSRDFYIVECLSTCKYTPRVLDVGCGKSEILLATYKHLTRIDYHGIDLNYKDLKNTLETIHTTQSYSLYHASIANNFPAKITGHFDFILLLDVIEHLPTLKQGLELVKNSLKYLKVGGIMFITTPNKANADNSKEFVCGSSHEHEFTRTELLEYFNSLPKFKIVKEMGSWLSQSKANKLISNSNFAKRIYTEKVGPRLLKLDTLANYYPQYVKELFYEITKI